MFCEKKQDRTKLIKIENVTKKMTQASKYVTNEKFTSSSLGHEIQEKLPTHGIVKIRQKM